MLESKLKGFPIGRIEFKSTFQQTLCEIKMSKLKLKDDFKI
jgi:hypothetical protein